MAYVNTINNSLESLPSYRRQKMIGGVIGGGTAIGGTVLVGLGGTVLAATGWGLIALAIVALFFAVRGAWKENQALKASLAEKEIIVVHPTKIEEPESPRESLRLTYDPDSDLSPTLSPRRLPLLEEDVDQEIEASPQTPLDGIDSSTSRILRNLRKVSTAEKLVKRLYAKGLTEEEESRVNAEIERFVNKGNGNEAIFRVLEQATDINVLNWYALYKELQPLFGRKICSLVIDKAIQLLDEQRANYSENHEKRDYIERVIFDLKNERKICHLSDPIERSAQRQKQ